MERTSGLTGRRAGVKDEPISVYSLTSRWTRNRRQFAPLGAAWKSGRVNCEIFLCQGAQGGRGRGLNSVTFGPNGDETSDQGVWMSVWVDDVDEVYERCLAQGLDVTSPPANHPWNAREMHVRHPDGHVFRISRHLRKGERAS